MLHLGAHKTASTHLQKWLSAQRPVLEAQGCAYLGPDLLRRGDLKLPSLDRPAQGVRRKTTPMRVALEQFSAERLLLSDENILGETRPPSLADETRLYPRAESRLAKLLDALDLDGVALALALRDPLTLLISSWGHQHLAGKPCSFEAFCEGLTPLALRWSELVARLLMLGKVRTILLWRYEEYPSLFPIVTEHLTGVSGALEAGKGAKVLTGPSAKAIAEATQRVATDPGRDYKQSLRRAMRQFPRGEIWPAAEFFDAAERAESDRLYAEDCARLCAMPGVTFLTDSAHTSSPQAPYPT